MHVKLFMILKYVKSDSNLLKNWNFHKIMYALNIPVNTLKVVLQNIQNQFYTNLLKNKFMYSKYDTLKVVL